MLIYKTLHSFYTLKRKIVVLIILSCFANSPLFVSGQKCDSCQFSVSVYVEPQAILFEYLSIGDKFYAEWDKYNGSNQRFSFLPGRAFQFGGIIQYKMNERYKLYAGIAYLSNQWYIADYNDKATPGSKLTFKLYEYTADFLRIPVGVIFNPLPDKKIRPVIGFGANVDFMTYEKVTYIDQSLYGPDIDSQKLFVLDRIVPSVSLGLEKKKDKKINFRFNIVYYFRSAYQHAHREFYFKNQSLGFNFSITHQFKK